MAIQEEMNFDGWVVQAQITPSVWKVVDHLNGQVAAVRLIGDGLLRDRSILELVEVLRVEHVPECLGVYEVPPGYAVLTRWIEGTTLRTLIDRNPAGMELELIARIAVPILRTMHKIHALVPQFIHSGVEPSEVIIENGSQKPWLIGVPRLAKPPRGYSVPIHPPHYTAPEVIQCRAGDTHAADIYAFGIMLFEMATGRKPFNSAHADYFEFLRDLQNQHIYSQPPWVEDFRPGLGEHFELVVQKAIEKNPAHRWDTCGEMAEMLEQFLPPSHFTLPMPAGRGVETRSQELPS